jgi:hypothetical protein
VILRALARVLMSNWLGAGVISLRVTSALLFAFFIMEGSTSTAFAHALPGSVLIFSENDNQLSLIVTFSLDDLVIVEPEFERLANVAIDASLPEQELATLRRYIKPHIALSQTSKPLSLRVTNASIAEASNEHIGKFSQVKVNIVTNLNDPTSMLPITLNYDLLMHEIRSHRATVYWQSNNGELKGIVDFGYKLVGGNPQVYELMRP